MKKGTDYPGITIVFFCHDGNGNYLFNKRSTNCRDEHDRWDCGGGSLDFGHTVEQTLEKEIEEEYCTKVLDCEFLGYRDVHRAVEDGKVTSSHWIALIFKVLVDRKLVKNGEPHKFEQIDWFRMESLPTPLHSQLPAALSLYKNRL